MKNDGASLSRSERRMRCIVLWVLLPLLVLGCVALWYSDPIQP